MRWCLISNRYASLWLLLLVSLPLLAGCVRRRLLVNSNPPGALVYVDNQQVGTTPCGVDFTYYGTREIRLIKPGFETLTVNQPIPTPWYQIPPLDFISENLVPTKIRDNRTVSFQLAPQQVIPTDAIIARGEELRQTTAQEPAVPADVTFPAGTPPPFAPSPAPIAVPPDNVPPLPFAAPPISAPATQPQFGPPLVSPPLR